MILRGFVLLCFIIRLMASYTPSQVFYTTHTVSRRWPSMLNACATTYTYILMVGMIPGNVPQLMYVWFHLWKCTYFRYTSDEQLFFYFLMLLRTENSMRGPSPQLFLKDKTHMWIVSSNQLTAHHLQSAISWSSNENKAEARSTFGSLVVIMCSISAIFISWWVK